jgi:hypothetical protein
MTIGKSALQRRHAPIASRGLSRASTNETLAFVAKVVAPDGRFCDQDSLLAKQ